MSRNAPADVSTVPGQYWPRFVIVVLAILYLAGVAIGWATNGNDGYYGITRIAALQSQANRLTITGVAASSPAGKAGLHPGDVILAIDGERLGETLAPGSRGRWVGLPASPTFQTRPLSVPPGDAPLLRRTTGNRKPGERTTLQIQRPNADATDSTDHVTRDVSLVLESHLSASEVVAALLVWHIVALLTLAVGAFVLLRRPSDIASRLLLATVGSFAMALLLLSWDNRPIPNDVAFALQLATGFLLVLGSASLLHLCLAFPAPHPALTRLGSLGPDALAPIGRATVAIYLPPLTVTSGLYLAPAAVWPWSNVIEMTLIGVALLALVRSMLHPPTPTARAQLKWIAGPLVVGLLGLALGPGVTAVTGGASEILSPTATVAAWGLFPLGIGVAILRYRLFDIDLVLRAAMFYPLLAALLGAGYLAASTVAGRIASTFIGPGAPDDLMTSVLPALLVAAAAQPAYRRLQLAMDRKFYKDRLIRQSLLEEVTAILVQAQPEDVATFLTGHVVNRLGLAGAWLVLPNGVISSDGFLSPELRREAEPLLARMRDITEPVLLDQELLASGGPSTICAGDPAKKTWYEAGARLLLPLCTAPGPGSEPASGLLGLWMVGTRRSGSLLDSEDVKALAQIARQASVLLDYDRLHWREAADIKRTARFRRYFSPQIADLIASEGGELATHRREVTVLLAELRGLSAVGQGVEPEELVGQLNDCLAAMTEVIFGHGGTLDKYLGDGVMVFFGDPLPQPDHAARAVQAALAMQRRLEELRRGSASRAMSFTVGIGIATSWVTAGTIGSLARQEYTVVGDAVGVAARLASACGPGEVLLAEKTKALTGDEIALISRGEVLVEGRRQPVLAFGVAAETGVRVDGLGTPGSRIGERVRGDGVELVVGGQVGPELLARTALFASLPPEELQRLSTHLRIQRFKKGATIVRADDSFQSFFLIRSGTVKVNRALVTGDEAVINILGPGEFFGEMSLLEDQGSGSTVVALQPTEILVLSREVFLECLHAYPSAASAAIAFLSQRVRRLSEQLEDAYSLELPQRLARRLLALGNTHGKRTEEGLLIDLPLTQSDLAGLVGASRQRVNRLLGEWQDRRLLQLGSSGRLTLLRPETFSDLTPEPLDG